jgi:hypothetical protein
MNGSNVLKLGPRAVAVAGSDDGPAATKDATSHLEGDVTSHKALRLWRLFPGNGPNDYVICPDGSVPKSTWKDAVAEALARPVAERISWQTVLPMCVHIKPNAMFANPPIKPEAMFANPAHVENKHTIFMRASTADKASFANEKDLCAHLAEIDWSVERPRWLAELRDNKGWLLVDHPA